MVVTGGTTTGETSSDEPVSQETNPADNKAKTANEIMFFLMFKNNLVNKELQK